MQRILFVCLGNICRSPLAEAIFKHKIDKLGLIDKFHVDSCGTADYHIGCSPDPRTVKNALGNGVQMSHACRQLCVDDFSTFDLILVMDHSNYRNATRIAPADKRDKVQLLRNYDPVGEGLEVPDPYYGGEKDFQEVFDILDRSIDALISQAANQN